MSFAPGDEVVCINAKGPLRSDRATIPVEGRHYIIRDGGILVAGRVCCLLVEIVNPVCNYVIAGERYVMECVWEERRFRPVRRDAIEQFHQMCEAASNGKTLVPVGD